MNTFGKTYKKQQMKLFLRIIALPFVLPLIWISYTYHAFKRAYLFLLYGGEFTSYEKSDMVTIKDIYEELKKQNNNK